MSTSFSSLSNGQNHLPPLQSSLRSARGKILHPDMQQQRCSSFDNDFWVSAAVFSLSVEWFLHSAAEGHHPLGTPGSSGNRNLPKAAFLSSFSYTRSQVLCVLPWHGQPCAHRFTFSALVLFQCQMRTIDFNKRQK